MIEIESAGQGSIALCFKLSVSVQFYFRLGEASSNHDAGSYFRQGITLATQEDNFL